MPRIQTNCDGDSFIASGSPPTPAENPEPVPGMFEFLHALAWVGFLIAVSGIVSFLFATWLSNGSKVVIGFGITLALGVFIGLCVRDIVRRARRHRFDAMRRQNRGNDAR